MSQIAHRAGILSSSVLSSYTPVNAPDSIWFDSTDTSTIMSADTDASTGQATIVDNTDVYSHQAKGSYSNLPLITQITSANRPVWQDTGVIQYNGTSDFLSAARRIFDDDGPMWSLDGITAFALVTANPGGNTPLFMEGYSLDTDALYGPLYSASSPASTQVAFARDDNNATRISPSTAIETGVFDNTLKVTGVTIDHTGANVTVTPYDAATAGTPVDFAIHAGTMNDIDQFAVGCLLRTSASNHFAMDLVHLVICPSVLSSGDISDLAGFLAP